MAVTGPDDDGLYWFHYTNNDGNQVIEQIERPLEVRPLIKYGDLPNDAKSQFDDIILGFREKMPSLDWMDDSEFIRGIVMLIENRLAKICFHSGNEEDAYWIETTPSFQALFERKN